MNPAASAAAVSPTPLKLKVLDFVLLQAGWFACVLGAAHQLYWLGPAVVAIGLALHMAFTPAPLRDLRTLCAVVVVGVLADLLMVACGVLTFPGNAPRLGPLPIWILVLWPLFGSNFHTTMGWLRNRLGLAAVLGAVGGPPGYVAADRFGALELGQPLTVALPALAAAWAVALPLGVLIARRNDPDGTTP